MLASDDPALNSALAMADLASHATPHSIVSLQHDSKGVTLGWSDARSSRFHVLWLRDNCACSECRHPQALERTYIFIDHAPPVLTSARLDSSGDLEVRFQQGTECHVSRFPHGWLRTHDPVESRARVGHLTPQPWNDDIAARLKRVTYSRYMSDRDAVRAWISALKVDGIVLLESVPQLSRQLIEVAHRIGPVRASNFGEYYDVISMPRPNASAYTSMGLELHTDLANWRYPPDIQLLFCLESNVTGGESVFGDGFRVAEELRTCDRAAFDLLTTQPLEYRFHDKTCDIRTTATLIETDRDGRLQRVRFNNWLRGATVFPETILEPMYAAIGKFWRMLRDPTYQLHLRLRPGDLIAYDNHRVLHGRASFDASSGARHLQGCYINQEDVDSTLHMLDRPVD
jgi:alpha-ketoglutarate-dependent taurine dioxygenase